jgi:hypothetical protein
MTGNPLSTSAHSQGHLDHPTGEAREACRHGLAGGTCTETGHHRVLAALAPTPRRRAVYHGLDFTRYPERPRGSAKTPRPLTFSRSGAWSRRKAMRAIDALGRLPRISTGASAMSRFGGVGP